MASTITEYVQNIDITYPVPGKDNDTQGFRDNWDNIRSALLRANSEIEDLQIFQHAYLDRILLYGNTQPQTSSGVSGDVKGTIYATGDYVYICKNNYVSTSTDIWMRVPAVGASWPVATYTIVPDKLSVNEGSTVSYIISTAYVSTGTVLYWENIGTNRAADFVENINTGTVTIRNNSALFSLSLRNDLTTDPNKTIIITLKKALTGSPVATAQTVTVNDTSRTPPTYDVTPSVLSVAEGSTVVFTVTTTDVDDGTTLYYSNIGTTSELDFTVSSVNTGSITINNNLATIRMTLANDRTTEGMETIVIKVTTSTNGDPVAISNQVIVNDTSISPTPAPTPGPTPAPTLAPTPTFELTTYTGTITEGGDCTITLVTTNVPVGTSVPYTITGSGITDLDFDSMFVNNATVTPSLTGNFIVQTDGLSTLKFTAKADLVYEGDETLTVSLNNGQANVSVTILDTSREIVISTSTQTVNLFTLANSLYRQNIKFRVAAGVVVGSTSTSVPAMTVGNFPAGSVIDLFIETGAYIVGAGGNGGLGYGGSVSRGSSGGPAISGSANVTMNLTNNGTIGGGGGGGAGGAIWPGHLDMTGPANGDPNGGPGRSGGGGGGGAGSVSGSGGTPRYTNIPSQYGSPGTLTLGGAAGTGHCRAGAGGNLGNPGANSGNCDAQPGATGGAAGDAMVLNGMTINNIVRGTILGNVV